MSITLRFTTENLELLHRIQLSAFLSGIHMGAISIFLIVSNAFRRS